MKFKAIKSLINPAINMVSGVVPSRATIPALESILFKVQGDRLELIGTDLDVTVITSIHIDSSDEISFCVNSKLIKDALSKMPDIEIEFSIEGNTLTITYRGGRGKLQIPVESANDFPTPPVDSGISKGEFSSIVLKDAFSKCIKFTGDDQFRPVISGVYIESNDSGVSFVGTDAFRLCLIEKTGKYPELKGVIPRKAVMTLERILSNTEHACLVGFSDKLGVVETPVAKVFFRMIEGIFPSYRSVIPQEVKELAVVDKKSLFEAIERAKPFSSTESDVIRICGDFMEMSISAVDLDWGKSMSETIDIDGSITIPVGVKASMVLDCLSCVDAEKVSIGFISSTHPLVFTADREDIKMIVLPVRIS